MNSCPVLFLLFGSSCFAQKLSLHLFPSIPVAASYSAASRPTESRRSNNRLVLRRKSGGRNKRISYYTATMIGIHSPTLIRVQAPDNYTYTLPNLVSYITTIRNHSSSSTGKMNARWGSLHSLGPSGCCRGALGQSIFASLLRLRNLVPQYSTFKLGSFNVVLI